MSFPTYLSKAAFCCLTFTLALLALLTSSCGNASGEQPAQATAAKPATSIPAVIAGLRQKFNTYKNIYAAEARIAQADASLSTGQDPANSMLMKASALVEYGDEAKAVALYEDLLKRAQNLSVESRNQILQLMGVAYLRLGERNNCVSGHMAESCIMPIRGSGVHQNKDGSRKAIQAFEEILKADPNNLDVRWLVNIAYMTLGEYPKKVPAAYLIPGLDAPSAYPVKPFTDVAMSLGIDTRTRSGGSIVDDFDGDGYLDIVTSAWDLSDPMYYFHNNGDGTFADWSAKSGLHDITGGLNMTQADYNNDGHLDILLLRGAWQGMTGFGEQPNSLLRNNGDGTFTDVTIEAGILTYRPTQTATWNDFNNDGWLDLFIANESTVANAQYPCELYINKHDGTFSSITAFTDFPVLGFFKGVTSGDYDNDGWADLYLSNMAGSNVLLHNRGVHGDQVMFDNVSAKAGFDKDQSSTFTTWFWDYDNDGWLDLFCCNYEFTRALSFYKAKEALHLSNDQAGKPYFYHNNHDDTFTNVTAQISPNQTIFSMGGNFGDIDNDGWLDMYLGTGNPDFKSLVPNKMLRNMDGKKFVDVTNAARVGNLQKGHGVSFADLDNDGDQDIHATMGGAYRGDAYYKALYLNPGQNSNHWINMRLTGVASNKMAIGIKMALTFHENGKERLVYRELNSGGSFGCSPLRREIGVGKATVIDEIKITWPVTGQVQVLQNVPVDQFIHITEGQTGFETITLNKLPIKKGNVNMPMCAPTK